MTKEVLKLALVALEEINQLSIGENAVCLPAEIDTAMDAIKEALAQPEPVAWVGLNLDNMAEAFHRVIEEHHSRKNPFHDPVNGDAMIALRELRGLISYMKRNTTPPQRTWVGLTDVEIVDIMDVELTTQSTEHFALCQAIESKLKEKNT
jgi:hypothetical protein